MGQGAWEEVNLEPAADPGGRNYGWNVMEGPDCFEASSCDKSGLTPPVHAFRNGTGGACAVTGGFVYRGSAVPALRGRYLFSDFCAGFVRALTLDGDEVTGVETLFSDLGQVSSFGEDGAGELYVLDISGTVHKIVPAG